MAGEGSGSRPRGAVVQSKPLAGRAAQDAIPHQCREDALTDIGSHVKQTLRLRARQAHARHLLELGANTPEKSFASCVVTPFRAPHE